MLHVLTGRSRRLWPRILSEISKELENPDHAPLYVFTPEHFTLEAEMDLVQQLHLKGLWNLEVLSPANLTRRVFTAAGAPQRVRMDDRGRAMALSEAVRRSAGALEYYRSAVDTPGLCEKIGTVISGLKQANLSPEDLNALLSEMSSEPSSLFQKLSDVQKVYTRYETLLSGSFLDGEDVQEALLDRLESSGMFNQARIWVYGFDLITLQFLKLITKLSRICDYVCLTLTLDSASAADGAIYQPVRDTLHLLGRHMDEEQLLWTCEALTDSLNVHPEISFTEEALFAIPAPKWEKKPEHVFLSCAQDPYDEINRIAEKMRHLALEGVSYGEMALILGSEESYLPAIRHVFTRAGIPFHLQQKRSAAAHPLIRSLLSALSFATDGMSMDDGVDVLCGSLCPLTHEESELLENYVLEHGLRGRKWHHEIADTQLDILRVRFLQPLLALQTRLKEAVTGSDTLSAVYGYLEDADAYNRMSGWEALCSDSGFEEDASLCTQAWTFLMETLDQLNTLLGGHRLAMSAVTTALQAGVSAGELGVLPSNKDAVFCGALGKLKPGNHLKAVFLGGMTDGILGTSSAEELFSSEEAAQAEAIIGKKGVFGAQGDDFIQLRKISLLECIASAGEYLYFSYPLCAETGEELRPAAVLSLLRSIFPLLKVDGGVTEASSHFFAPNIALDALGSALRKSSDTELCEPVRSAALWLLRSPDTSPRAEQVLRMLTRQTFGQNLPAALAHRLYRRQKVSVSRIECFASCPYQHFIRYGLRPQERREYSVERSDMGLFYHAAMDAFTELAASSDAFPNLTREQIDDLTDKAIAPLMKEWEQGILGDSERFRAQGRLFCRVLKRAARTLTAQLRHSHFRPCKSEIRFGPGQVLPPVVLECADGKVLVEGRIDRVDLWENEGTRWLRVIDYKSGNTKLEPAKLLGGQQLQLILYLYAALCGEDDSKPAGAFYAHIDDPLANTPQRLQDVVEKELLKQLRLKGITVADVHVIHAMDDGDTSMASLYTKDGSPKKDAPMLPLDQLEKLLRHALQISSKMADAWMSGEIAPAPYQYHLERPCTYCKSTASCDFAAHLIPGKFKKLDDISLQEALNRITLQEDNERSLEN